MTVKELIEELLEYDMDHEVQVQVETDDDTNFAEFGLGDNPNLKEVYLAVDFEGEVLIDKARLEELEELEEMEE
ncbi:hypothetical protein GCM10008934_02850 [Virgibacillus salarius]|uniref:hypothetical protein n=1 Tax=Virgibacillus salarius TaxID=447199 RepID=UPI0031DA7EB1